MDHGPATAARLLARVFESLDVPLAFRLWDGTLVPVGARAPAPCTVVVHSPHVMRRLLLRPSSLAFGEAFVSGEIDIEGDVFAAAELASHVERLRVPIGTRLAVLTGLAHL
jgi:cyclopropane-fatty-acyl-phospholipid synthase